MSAPDDELLLRLAQFPQRVRPLLDAFDIDDARARPAAGAFLLVEHLCHLRDLEAEGYALRIRRILDEEMPQLDEIDGSALAVQRHYQSQDPLAAWTAWSRSRAANVEVLRATLAPHGARTGIFGGFGVVTLATLAEGIAGHDESHWSELGALSKSRALRPGPTRPAQPSPPPSTSTIWPVM